MKKVSVTFLIFLLASNAIHAQSSSSPADFKTYSKFDFVPGEQVIFYDDFSQDIVGDMPAKWNTNASGEIITLSNISGKWLKTVSEGSYKPELNNKAFPDNYTIEFDAIFTADDMDGSNSLIDLNIYSSSGPNSFDAAGSSGSKFHVIGTDVGAWNTAGLESSQEKRVFVGKSKKVMRFSVWIQKKRGRLYIDDTKVLDIAQFIPEEGVCNAFSFFAGIYGEGERTILVSNVRIAVGAPDMRNKLITDGKLVTRGILFDVNSDKIKAESYGTLKEIANVLNDNPTVRVKIVGFTDSDGDDKANLELSKRRALSVKNSLSKDFGIDISRMESDGKGELEPSSPNSTPAGKANNRRVEFIKL